MRWEVEGPRSLRGLELDGFLDVHVFGAKKVGSTCSRRGKMSRVDSHSETKLETI